MVKTALQRHLETLKLAKTPLLNNFFPMLISKLHVILHPILLSTADSSMLFLKYAQRLHNAESTNRMALQSGYGGHSANSYVGMK